jgi:hypothetical protein
MIFNNLVCIGLLGLVLSLPKTAANSVNYYPLFAGQNTLVGTVTVAPNPLDDSQISIEYQMGPGWCATHVHIHAEGVSGEDPFPVNRQGNPQVGRFEINEPQGCSSANTFTTEAPCGTPFDIAFHANVENVGWDLFPTTALTASMQAISYPGDTNLLKDSYWDIEIEGIPYDAWCVDTDRTMTPGGTYEVAMWSSLDTDALIPIFDPFETPGNFTKVNWILNQDFVGKSSDCGDGTVYDFLDVQEAIWRLIENEGDVDHIGNDCRVTEIFDAAYAYEDENGGEEFVPRCDDYMAIVLVPVDANGDYQRIIAQVIVAQVEIACGYGTATAWAAMPGPEGGTEFVDGKSWGTHFSYVRGCRRLLRGE